MNDTTDYRIEVKSNVERTIYKWFENLKCKNCVVRHSLGIAHHEKNIFGEIDLRRYYKEAIQLDNRGKELLGSKAAEGHKYCNLLFEIGSEIADHSPEERKKH